jgi:hypothetical protein
MREHVTDESDMATEREMMDTALAIQLVRNRAEEIQPIGSCYYCSEPVQIPKKFCSGVCASDYAQLTRVLR